MKLRHFVRLARPGHWVKNVIVLFPVFFALRMTDRQAWGVSALAALAFCFASSAAYILNDIRDRQRDRLHPRTKDRPLASGQVSVRAALAEAVVFLAACAIALAALNRLVAVVVLAYLILQTAYTFVLKQKMILDVMCIALGFILRALAGAVAIGAEISPWLVICTFTICLFMGFCKRCNEVVTLGDDEQATAHRATLRGYNQQLLTHAITLSAAIAVISFLLYGLSERTIGHFGTNYLIYTLPVVIYGIVRFSMLSVRGTYADPTDLILRDRPFQLTVLLWLAASLGIIYWGRDLKTWIEAHL